MTDNEEEDDETVWTPDLLDQDNLNLNDSSLGSGRPNIWDTDTVVDTIELNSLRSDVSHVSSKIDQYSDQTEHLNSRIGANNEQITDLNEKLERYNNKISNLADVMGNFSEDMSDTEKHLGDMSETLESRELNIFLVPPDTNVSRLATQVQIVIAAFLVVIALGQYIIPDAPFTFVSLAFGVSILVNLITNYLYPIRE